MTSPDDLAVGERALRLAVLTLPHLAGLARVVRLAPDRRHPTAGVFASGRVVFNPDFFRSLEPPDAAFVMAHELMHLALRTHRRGQGSGRGAVNVAHDYVINDMLVKAFGRPVPGGGLYQEGASGLALERLLAMLRGGELPAPGGAGGGGLGEDSGGRPRRALAGGLSREPISAAPGPTGSPARSEPVGSGDALEDALERDWFPQTDSAEQARQQEEVERQGARAVSIGVLREAMSGSGQGQEAANADMLATVLRGYYHTPWEAALQRWLEFAAPADRTFARPSRRGAERTDVVLPGRNRVGWTLNVILDTSGSMTDEVGRALGAIASFCESVGVWQVRLLQCDTTVTADEFVEPERLAQYEIRGLGGSDMSPAMLLLADDPEVEAVVVLTDGYISYPDEPMPYRVLWGILTDGEDVSRFNPPYGLVLPVPVSSL
jgi:predicted metal-dependent peptidase